MKKVLIYLFSALIILAVSCTEEETNSNIIAADEAKTAIQNTSDDLSLDVVEITQSEGVQGLKQLFDLIANTDLFSGGRQEVKRSEYTAILKEKARAIRSAFVPEKSINGKITEGDFVYADHLGIYDWNFFEERFVQTGESEFIVLNFPTEGSTTLNATLRLTAFEEVEITDDFGSYKTPTVIAGDLTIDGELLIDLNFAMSYNNVGDPVSGDIYLFLNPFTFELSFDDSGASSASLNASITKGDEVIVAVDIAVAFMSDNSEELSSITGFVQYRAIKVAGSINNVESDDPNDFINLKVYINDQFLGDIVFVAEYDDSYGELEMNAYIQYADGSMERVEDVFEPVIMEIEDFFDELDAWGNEGG